MGIAYSDHVKAPGVEDEYTAEEIKILKRCITDFEYFMKSYVMITTQNGKELFKPYPFQKEMMGIFSKYRFACILSSRQSGKCVDGESKVTIRNKKTGLIERVTMEELYLREGI